MATLKFYIEATSLANLDYILSPHDRPLRWDNHQWKDVLNFIEMLVLADRIVYSGRSEPNVLKDSEERLKIMTRSWGSDDIPIDKPRPEADEIYRDGAQHAANEFFTSMGDTILRSPDALIRDDILLGMPTDRATGKPKNPFNHLKRWQEWRSMASSKDVEGSFGTLCENQAKESGEDSIRFREGMAVFYAALRSDPAKKCLTQLKAETLENLKFLQCLNVSFRTYYNFYVANHLINERPDERTFYAPGMVRRDIFEVNDMQSFEYAARVLESKGGADPRPPMRLLWSRNPDQHPLGLIAMLMVAKKSGERVHLLIDAIKKLRKLDTVTKYKETLYASPALRDENFTSSQTEEQRYLRAILDEAGVDLNSITRPKAIYRYLKPLARLAATLTGVGIGAFTGSESLGVIEAPVVGGVGGLGMFQAADWFVKRLLTKSDRAYLARRFPKDKTRTQVIRKAAEKVFRVED